MLGSWEQDDLVANLTGLFEQCDRQSRSG